MAGSMESTYQGYISSTHDALLVFECVRRGVMPKVKRRLREDERKLVQSGQVFVFDERESGIKRWTDGLLWSPSRILWNFLVYRQVDKKLAGRGTGGQGQDSLDGSPTTADLGLLSADQQPGLLGSRDPFALGVDTSFGSEAMAMSMSTSAKSDSPQHAAYPGSALGGPSRLRSVSSASDSFAVLHANGMVGNDAAIDVGSLPSQKDVDDERSLVGSLRSSYPFAKGGLCKKTISIQLDGTTQHLISYYTVEDVRSGRLRTPSSLPEIASLTISPIYLKKTSFRFPPAVVMGPDGIPRFRAEEGGKGDVSAESSGEGTSSGSDSRHQHPPSRRAPPAVDALSKSSPLGTAVVMSRNTANLSVSPMAPSSTMSGLRQAPMAHQVGGSGFYRPSRRASDVALRASRSRFEPYAVPATTGPASGYKASGGESSVSTSPSSLPTTPFVQPVAGGTGGYDVLPDPVQQLSPMGYRLQQTQQSPNDKSLSEYQQHQQQDRRRPSGMPMGVDVGVGEGGIYREGDGTRERLLQEMIAEQQQYELQNGDGGLLTWQRNQELWNLDGVQHGMSSQRPMFQGAHADANWSATSETTLFKTAATKAPGMAAAAPSADGSGAHSYGQGYPNQQDPSYPPPPGPSPHRDLWQDNSSVSLHANHGFPYAQQQQYHHPPNHASFPATSVHMLDHSQDQQQPSQYQQQQHAGNVWSPSNAMPTPPSSFLLNAPPGTHVMQGHPQHNRLPVAAMPTAPPTSTHYMVPERSATVPGHPVSQSGERSMPSDVMESIYLMRPGSG